MPIEFPCPSCQKQLRVPDNATGKQARCPSCSTVVTVPESSAPSPSDFTPPPSNPPAGGAPPQPPAAGPANPYAGANPFALQPPSDTGNPYQSPSHAAYDEPSPLEPGAIGHERIAFDDVLSTAWEMFKSQWLMACVVVVLAWLINLGISFLGGVVNGVAAVSGDQAIIGIVQMLVTFGSLVPQTWLGIGQFLVFFEIARGVDVNVGTLFKGGPYLLRTLGASLLLGVCIMFLLLVVAGIPAAAVGIIAQDAGAAAIAGLIGALAGMGIMVVPILMVSQFYGLIVDGNLGAIESLKTSIRITNGNKVSIFVIYLLTLVIGIGAMLVGLLMCLVGVIPAMFAFAAYSSCVWVATYMKITGQPIRVKSAAVAPTNYAT